MIRVKFLKSHPSFGYFAGDMGSVTPEAAEKLLKGGYILPLPGEEQIVYKDIEPVKPSAPVNPLPDDFPARDKLFAAGFVKIEDIKAAGDGILDVPGISNNVLKKVNKYLDKYVFGN